MGVTGDVARCHAAGRMCRRTRRIGGGINLVDAVCTSSCVVRGLNRMYIGVCEEQCRVSGQPLNIKKPFASTI